MIASRRPAPLVTRAVLALAVSTMAAGTAPLSAAAPDPLAAFAAEVEKGRLGGVTGALLSRRGEVVVEAYAPGNRSEARHDIRSATKSITAILVGELIADGRLRGVDVRLSELLPAELAHLAAGDARRDITVEDVPTMRTGLACDDWVPASVGHEDKMYETSDWVAFLLRQPLAHEVGRHFSSCTGGVVALGRVIERLSGTSVPEFELRLVRAVPPGSAAGRDAHPGGDP